MFSWFKKHFIPHEGNDHRPHILRDYNIRNIVALVIFLEIFTFLIPILSRINVTGGMAAVLPAVLSLLTNDERQSENLRILTVNPILNKAAEMKAMDMATKGYFAHTSPEGKTPWYWLDQVGYKYQYAGENLAVNFSDSKDVTNAWMASATHKANIVKWNYSEIGTGIATGMYKGRETTFVAQVYANPIPRVEVSAQPVKTEVKTELKTEVKKASEAPKITIVEEPTNVLGTEVSTLNETSPEVVVTETQNIENITSAPTFWQKLFVSPRNTTNVILYIVFGIITLALLLYIFIKIRNHHKDLITNGLVTLAIVGAIFVANYYFSYNEMLITQSLDYSSENK